MGTVVVIDVYVDGEPEPDAVAAEVDRAAAVLHHADKVFSTWKPDSAMSRLRQGAITLDETPPEIGEVLTLCESARQLTRGWFDPWAMPGGVDPTGCIKGWAAQRALAALHAEGICGAIVNAAGDIASFGSMSGGQPFCFGIVDPHDPGRLACTVMSPGGLATSGTYERGEHLIDPTSGEARSRVASATVTGPDLGLADALATALAVAGNDGFAFVEDLDGYEALTVSFEGGRSWTEHFPFWPPADGPVKAQP
jgi:thiamine biosynthesis lipoprotein